MEAFEAGYIRGQKDLKQDTLDVINVEKRNAIKWENELNKIKYKVELSYHIGFDKGVDSIKEKLSRFLTKEQYEMFMQFV